MKRLSLIGRPGVIAEIMIPDDRTDSIVIDFPVPHLIYGLRLDLLDLPLPPERRTADWRFGDPWSPTHDGSDDGDFGPDQLVTCLICGATVEDRHGPSGIDARALHEAWHMQQSALITQEVPR